MRIGNSSAFICQEGKMKDNEELALIGEISNANGISGFEDDVLEVVRKHSSGLGQISEDCMRNLYIARKKNTGDKPVVQLDAHTDEVGFMVKAIRPDGMLEFITIGGWVATNIPAHLVRVRNSEGVYIQGVVASKPPHFMSEAERKAPLDVTSLVIDVGATSKDEVVNDFKIEVASPVVPDVDFIYDEKHRIMRGKAFDNRLGCASIIETLRALENDDLDVDIIGAFASQEEVGTRGATVTVERVKPDLAICFEGCPADDTVVPDYQVQTALKKGPMLRHIDARMITNPRFQRYALSLAKELGIPVQAAVRSAGATDGAPIHMGHLGVPVIVIGIPVRYAHTHYGYSSIDDYRNGIKLATEILKRIDFDRIKSF